MIISYNQYITLVGDADSGGGHACVGEGVYKKFLYIPLNCSVNLKPPCKIKYIFKKQNSNTPMLSEYVLLIFRK